MGASFGRGGATTFQQDLQNADCIVIMGSNMAENHPVGFQWVMEARERGAQVIHVDPRFTRTSAMATQHVTIRPGSDIAFLGGIVNYILTHERWFDEYVKAYTNAPAILDERFRACVNKNARLVHLYEGCRWAEGPAYFPAARSAAVGAVPRSAWNQSRTSWAWYSLDSTRAAGTTAWGENQCKNDKDGAVDFDERLPVTGVASALCAISKPRR